MRNRMRHLQSSASGTSEAHGNDVSCDVLGIRVATSRGRVSCLYQREASWIAMSLFKHVAPQLLRDLYQAEHTMYRCQGLPCKTKDTCRRYLDLVLVIFSTEDGVVCAIDLCSVYWTARKGVVSSSRPFKLEHSVGKEEVSNITPLVMV